MSSRSNPDKALRIVTFVSAQNEADAPNVVRLAQQVESEQKKKTPKLGDAREFACGESDFTFVGWSQRVDLKAWHTLIGAVSLYLPVSTPLWYVVCSDMSQPLKAPCQKTSLQQSNWCKFEEKTIQAEWKRKVMQVFKGPSTRYFEWSKVPFKIHTDALKRPVFETLQQHLTHIHSIFPGSHRHTRAIACCIITITQGGDPC